MRRRRVNGPGSIGGPRNRQSLAIRPAARQIGFSTNQMVVATLQEALVTALIAAGGSLTAVLISYWLPERRRQRDRAQNRREQAAQVIEPVRNLLIDAGQARNPGEASAVRARWVNDLRDPFTVFGMSQGSAEVSAAVLGLREVIGQYLDVLGSPNTTRETEFSERAVEMIRDLRSVYGFGATSPTDDAYYASAGRIWAPGRTPETRRWPYERPHKREEN